MRHILRLAYLSPTVVEAILDGKYPAHLTMKDLMEPFPMDWSMQEKIFLQPDQQNNKNSIGIKNQPFTHPSS